MLQLAGMYNGSAIKHVGKFFTAVVILTLFIMIGGLYRQNIVYKNENRKLILQNDSILSVNLELTQAAEKSASDSKLSVFKTARYKK